MKLATELNRISALLLTLGLTLFSMTQAQGQDQSQKIESYISCSNGSVTEQFENHVVVEIFEDAVKFHLYEIYFQLRNEEFSAGQDPRGMYMVGTPILVNFEGEEFSDSAYGVLSLAEDKKSATLDLAFDQSEMIGDQLTCEPATR